MAELFHAISVASSQALDRMLVAMSVAQRGSAAAAFHELKAKLLQSLAEKRDFWKHLPYRIIGVFWDCTPGGTVERAKEILAECIAEPDAAIQAGLKDRLHRVAVRLLDVGGAIGREFRLWLESTLDLVEFSRAYCALLFYALLSLVERRIESVHAIIKKVGAQSTYVLPPYVCARVRESYNLGSLKTDKVFNTLCERVWRQVSLLDSILRLRFSRETLQGMSRREKIQAVYQCDMDTEFEDMEVQKFQKEHWAKSVPALSMWTETRVGLDKHYVAWCKQSFGESAYISLPEDQSQEWRGFKGGSLVVDAVPSLVSLANMVFSDVTDVDLGSLYDIVFLRMVNDSPEARARVQIPHLLQSRSLMIFARCHVVAVRMESKQVLLEASMDLVRLDVGFVSASFDEVLRCIYR